MVSGDWDEGPVSVGRFLFRNGIGGGTQRSAPHRAAREPRKGDPGNSGTAVITRTKTQTKKPSMYRVLLLNDDYTPMEFVTHVLMRFFNKDADEASRIMMHVHQHGVGECGVAGLLCLQVSNLAFYGCLFFFQLGKTLLDFVHRQPAVQKVNGQSCSLFDGIQLGFK